ncbi:hypothetical protein F4825DRAFT_445175 [Nemania diffusa]|nr:hypothetical protein F4825DRAFT_445175 [Nemania diffusa]
MFGMRHRPDLKMRMALPSSWNQLMELSPSLSLKGNDQTKETGELALYSNSNLKILDIYLEALAMNATDIRDKLFALLLFAGELRSGKEKQKNQPKLSCLVQPNYKKPPNIVFADFTRWWIYTYQSLGILSYIHADLICSWRRMTCSREKSTLPIIDSKEQLERLTWIIVTEGRPVCPRYA